MAAGKTDFTALFWAYPATWSYFVAQLRSSFMKLPGKAEVINDINGEPVKSLSGTETPSGKVYAPV